MKHTENWPELVPAQLWLAIGDLGQESMHRDIDGTPVCIIHTSSGLALLGMRLAQDHERPLWVGIEYNNPLRASMNDPMIDQQGRAHRMYFTPDDAARWVTARREAGLEAGNPGGLVTQILTAVPKIAGVLFTLLLAAIAVVLMQKPKN